jgi:hypothetical protein
VFGEVIANVISNFKIVGSGVFFDRYSFRMSPPINNTDPRYSNGITRNVPVVMLYDLQPQTEILHHKQHRRVRIFRKHVLTHNYRPISSPSYVISNFKIVGSGVFFDRYSFRMSPPINNTDPRYSNGITREFFGPYAWVKKKGTGIVLDFKAEDFAGHEKFYTDEAWFRNMKARWQTNFVMLKKFTLKPMIRSDPEEETS